MRLIHAAALTAAATLLASIASAQGLGGAAAREREKRKAEPAKPAKVYTESDLGGNSIVLPPPSETPTEGAAENQASGEAAAKEGTKDPAADEEKARAEAEANWRKQLEQARLVETAAKDAIERTQADLGDPNASLIGPNRARRVELLEQQQQKLAEAQARIAALEEEGRRNRYR